MTPDQPPSHRRILVVDDNQEIHDDFRKILGAPDATDAALDAAEARLFGRPLSATFEIDVASQGVEALYRVVQAQKDGRPYAMAFVDYRMPPGWDGVETTRRIWQVCPELQIVICTAFADCSWDEVLKDLDPQDRLLILKKPFDAIEARQLANSLTEKCRLRQVTKTSLADSERAVRDRTRELEESQTAALNMMADAVRNREHTEQILADLRREVVDRKRAEAQFLQAQKMDAIGQLAGGIAHDFNNILAAIIGNVELARMCAPDDPGLPESLDAVFTASQRAADLVKQILAFSRRQEQAREPIFLHIVVREAVKLLRATIPAAVEFQTHVAKVRTVLGDGSQIHQVVMNLCTNAAHAMRDRPGVLQIELSEVELDAEFAQAHPDVRPGWHVCLRVTDNGSGMDRATVDRIFEPFFTTKAPGEGTGLGLSVVHGIVKNHEGSITVDSERGVGTTFHLYFPVFEASAAELAPDAPPVPVGHGERILFVDDEETLARLGETILKRLGYRVTAITSVTEALAVFQAQPEQFDLVITDLNMPVMNGTNFARQLLQIRPDIRIVLTTGYSARLTPELVRGMGFRELLPKPAEFRTLGETVQRVLAEPRLT
ncbi:MAG: hypothetical protein RL514_2418 [Verrucomicrobiota bacterium]|jgi:signal transduction histidine kinase